MKDFNGKDSIFMFKAYKGINNLSLKSDVVNLWLFKLYEFCNQQCLI